MNVSIRRIAYAINLIGKISILPCLLVAPFLYVDMSTPAQGVLRVAGFLSFPLFSLIKQSDKGRICLGAIGLLIALASVFLMEGETAAIRQARSSAFSAAFAGDVGHLSAALKNDIDPNLYIEDRGSLLAAAVVSGNPEAVKLLIESGADVDFAPNGGMTPLLVAMVASKCEPAVVLLQAGADVDTHLQHYENYAFGIEYKNISARELYYLNKSRRHVLWTEQQPCWLQFEKLMGMPLARADRFKEFWKNFKRKVYETLAAFTAASNQTI